MPKYIVDVSAIESCRAKNGLTKEELAVVLEITPVALRNKYSGTSQFKANELIELAERFNVDPAYFFTKTVSKIENTV